MRVDEEYVKESIKKYLYSKIDEFQIIEGDEPPDYYVMCFNKKILLEVTRAESIYVDNNEIRERNTVDQTLLKLCNQLDKELGSKIGLAKTLILDIKGPLMNYTKFKNTIKNKITSILDDGDIITMALRDWIEVEIADNIIRLKLIDTSPISNRIIGFISIKNNKSIHNIEGQASLILSSAIAKKEVKTKIINNVEWRGEKWLAILNNYWLASSDTYKRALNNLHINHTFSKLFLIEENFKVTLLFEN